MQGYLIFKLCVPFFSHALDILPITLINKYIYHTQDEYYKIFLIQVRELINEYYIDLFQKNEFYSYSYTKLKTSVMTFLNYKENYCYFSPKTMAFFVNLNILLLPPTHLKSLYHVHNDQIALIKSLENIILTKKKHDKIFLKRLHNLNTTKVMCQNKIQNYIAKVTNVGSLTKQLPQNLKNINKQISNPKYSSYKIGNTKRLCSRLIKDFNVVRTINTNLQTQLQMLETKQITFNVSSEKNYKIEQFIQMQRKLHILFVYNIEKDLSRIPR